MKYFDLNNDVPAPDGAGVRYDLSPIRGGRAKETVQQILVTYLLNSATTSSFIVVEEAPVGPFLRDILIMARRRGQRLIMVSQLLPENLNNFEILLFTPWMSNFTKSLPIPVDPALDRGVWWIGRLGVKRLSLSLR